MLGAKWGYESHRWDGLSDPGIRLCRLPTLVPFSSTNLHPGTGLLPPLARKSGLVGTSAGAEIKLGPEPEPGPEPGPGLGPEPGPGLEPGPGPGSMADVPKLKGNGQSQSRV